MSGMTPIEQCRCNGDEVPGPHDTFWCKYHQVRKTQHWLKLCRERDEFRAAWNSGTGPGQQKTDAESQPAGPMLGDAVARLLGRIGVTEDRYKEAKERFGLPPTCNCADRQAWLNRVSLWWSRQPPTVG